MRTVRALKPALYVYDQGMRPIHAIGWRTIRFSLAAVYLVYLVNRLVSKGVPTDREMLAKLVMLGLAISVLGRGWKKLLWVVIDWLPFTIVLVIYDNSRKIADTAGMPLHVTDVVGWEKAIFFGHVPTVWLQQHFYQVGHVHWYDALASLIYSSHFLVTPVLAAYFWFSNHRVFYRYISRVILLSFAGLATYVLFPEAPPWMASQDHVIGQIHRISALGWTYLHAGFAHRALESGQNGGANPVAAMPSLHFAFSVLAAMFLASQLKSRRRNLVYIYPVLMAVTLVYTGEHYVVDEIAGLVYVLAVHFGLLKVEQWWRSRGAGDALEADGNGETSGTQVIPEAVETESSLRVS